MKWSDTNTLRTYLAANVRLLAAAQSMYEALWVIANMQVKEETDKGEVLELCMSIARLELEKCKNISGE